MIDLSSMKQLAGGEYQGAHPVHGSETGMNFTVNLEKDCWHCFRCNSGGGPDHLKAVLDGKIQCNESYKGNPKIKHIVEDTYCFDIKIPGELKERVIELLLQKFRNSASEKIVRYIKKNVYLYTIRDDEHSEVWIYHKGIYAPHGKTYIREFCRKILGKSYTTAFANSVISKIEVDTYIDNNTFFNNVNVDEIVVENGILNIFSKELTEFSG